MYRFFTPFIIAFLMLTVGNNLQAQCNTTISNFPYVEDFETDNGGWQSGGSANDWGWGIPTKPVITAAGSGTKCWIVGGPDMVFYNINEKSYLLPPCFDFTNVLNPMVSFKIFWESEKNYDGTNLQYSINNGSTWINVGSINDNDCFTQNWYNNANIINLTTLATSKQGWSGNIQTTGSASCGLGGGSGSWKLAQHCLSNLGGQSSVRLRFTFGAGSVCNAYDGIAIDSFAIAEAPPIFDAFIMEPTDNCNEYYFKINPIITTSCFNNLQFSWNFGDGTTNTGGNTAIHTYQVSGTYPVTVSVLDNCVNQSVTQTLMIDAPELSFNSTAANCNVANGSATVLANGNNIPTAYLWNTTPPQNTATATNVFAGDYVVTVTLNSGCTYGYTVNVPSDYPLPNVNAGENQSITCNNPLLTLNGSSLTPNVSFEWTGPSNFNSNNNIPTIGIEGQYVLLVTDPVTSCYAYDTTMVMLDNSPPTVNAGNASILTCTEPMVTLQGSTSVTDATISWVGPDGFAANILTPNTSTVGDYTLTVINNQNGCINDDVTTVSAANLTPDTTLINLKTCIDTNVGTQIIGLTNQAGCDSIIIIKTIYNDTSIVTIQLETICETTCFDFAGRCLDEAGVYTDTLQTIEGCDSIILLGLNLVHCPWLDQALYIPNTFSPNYDGINDIFKPEGINFEQYEMKVFDRWGEEVFSTNTINDGWDGTFRGKVVDTGIYAYFLKIRFINGNSLMKKGDIMLVK